MLKNENVPQSSSPMGIKWTEFELILGRAIFENFVEILAEIFQQNRSDIDSEEVK